MVEIENVLILDTETTGLTSEPDAEVIEIATILYSVQHKTVLQQLSTLIPVKANPAEIVNKISTSSSHAKMPYQAVLNLIKESAAYFDYVIAHNAEFDSAWMLKINLPELLEKRWICSVQDFEWDTTNKKLTEIALSLDIPVLSAHRALTDCQLLAACFSKIPNLSERLLKALQPKNLYRANVNYDDRALAKDAGFVWDKLVPRCWAARMTEEKVKSLSFSVTRLDN